METIAERIVAQRRAMLSPFACADDAHIQRDEPITPCALRTDFQRDRDRIIHCKAFRRMKHKTQCFLSPEGDHFRTRLTHTLEVAQIARTLSRALMLNEDLTEAIALGHDLGHTPFGHMGERILDQLVPGGFAHEQQSLRVVTRLEHDGKGLNLTAAVRDGIVNHTSRGNSMTLEGQVVSLADRIAYINHDIDDALRAGALHANEIPSHLLDVLGHSHGQRIDSMIHAVVDSSLDRDKVQITGAVGQAMQELRAFMFAHVYTRPVVQREEKKAEFMLRSLFEYYMQHMDALPQEFCYDTSTQSHIHAVCDYIACMTDRYAVHRFSTLFIPGQEVLLH